MASIARQVADNASFQAFTNAYLKEIDKGVWHSLRGWRVRTGLEMGAQDKFVLELQLNDSGITLAIGVAFRSMVGRHKLTDIYQQRPGSMEWHGLDSISAIMLLIKEIYANPGHEQGVSDQELELTARTIESHQVMTQYLEARHRDPALKRLSFIDSEQSVLFGHWLHPTPKSRQGMHNWQHQHYAPELKGRFKLHFFAAKRQLVIQSSAASKSAEQIVQEIAGKEGCEAIKATVQQQIDAGNVLLAVHPLQAQWLLKQDYIQTLMDSGDVSELGALGPVFTPTSSVRTLYCDELDYMLKVSIPVKITNSMRVNMRHELDAGVTLAKLLQTSGFSEQSPCFQVIGDPAYLSLALPGREESGFELIIRDNPFDHQQGQLGIGGIQSIAALVQEPVVEGDRSRLADIIHTLAEQQGQSLLQVSLLWFEQYLSCAIQPAISLFDKFGIALEAHQQNSLLDVTEGFPKTYYYRDNQGFYLSKSCRHKLLEIEPDLSKCTDLFYRNEMIYDRFGYYLIINQLFSVINRFGLDQLASEETLLKIAKDKLVKMLPQMQKLGVNMIESILYRKGIPCKGNLLTRVGDVDELQAEYELAVYTQIRNPLYTIRSLPSAAANILTEEEACLGSI